MGRKRIYDRRGIISCKGIIGLAYLIDGITPHVGNERWKKGIARITTLLCSGIRKDHGLGIVGVVRPSSRPSASTGQLASTGYRPSARPSASTGLCTSTGLVTSTGLAGCFSLSRLHALIKE